MRATGGTCALIGKVSVGELETSLKKHAQDAAWMANIAGSCMLQPQRAAKKACRREFESSQYLVKKQLNECFVMLRQERDQIEIAKQKI